MNYRIHNRSIIPDLLDRDGNICSADLDKANALNLHFGQTFIDDNGLFPPFANKADNNFINSVSFTVSKAVALLEFKNWVGRSGAKKYIHFLIGKGDD